MNNLPKVAVVILNWNGKQLLEQFLPSVLSSDYENLEIYVADNASTDDSVKMLEENFKMVKILQLQQNFGFAEGYNQALQQISAPYSVLLNSDVEVSPDWITPIIRLMEKDPSVAACQPKILAYHQKTHFEYAGASGGWLDMLGYAFCRGRFFDQCEEDSGQYNSTEEIFWASGCALFIRTALFYKIGGFDRHFFAHMEEIDLCWRLKRSGYRIMVCPDSVVYHVGGGSLHKSNPRKTFLNYHNNLIMLFKNLPVLTLLWLLPFRMLLDWISCFKLIAERKFRDARAILKAQFYFLKGIRIWYRNRKQTGKIVSNNLQPHVKKYKNLTGLYRGSIIIRHFLLRVNKFSDLKKG